VSSYGGSAFFSVFVTWQIAKRKFSKANVMLVSAHMRAFTEQLRTERAS
jgi:hypothetical protein